MQKKVRCNAQGKLKGDQGGVLFITTGEKNTPVNEFTEASGGQLDDHVRPIWLVDRSVVRLVPPQCGRMSSIFKQFN
jgi:hypothetical protein